MKSLRAGEVRAVPELFGLLYRRRRDRLISNLASSVADSAAIALRGENPGIGRTLQEEAKTSRILLPPPLQVMNAILELQQNSVLQTCGVHLLRGASLSESVAR